MAEGREKSSGAMRVHRSLKGCQADGEGSLFLRVEPVHRLMKTEGTGGGVRWCGVVGWGWGAVLRSQRP